jgi:stalled ribosome rescue protein Dom34
MTLYHAVVWLDHQTAQVIHFDAEQVEVEKVRAHHHFTRHHTSAVRTEHEFFGEVCDALAGVGEVLVTGSRTALSDFRHYIGKHRPQTAPLVAGYEPVDHPSDGQLLKLARQFFIQHDRMAGTPTPMS